MRSRPESTLLAVIDVQEKLLPVMEDSASLIDRIGRLADAAAILGVRRVLTEQYPKGLGPTTPALAGRMPRAIEKLSFSCCGSDDFLAAVQARQAGGEGGIESVVLAGVETHVCVLQTGLDLLAMGCGLFVPIDAVRSRRRLDHDAAIRRLEAAGAIITSSEAILFEWCRSAKHPRFQEIRSVVLREGPPEA